MLFAFLLAMIVTMALVPPFMRLAARWGVLDAPGARKVHAHPIPRVGGIAMYLGFLAPLLLWLPIDRLMAAYLGAATVLVAFGVWDDRVELGVGAKLLGQLLAVGLVVFAGGLHIHTLTLEDYVALPDWIGSALTILFLIGITNAINLSDGLDGLAGGTTLLCCGVLAALALSTQQSFVFTVAVVLMGSILGFLRYNSHPARIFMGDAGSQFLGFSVGVLALVLTQNQQTVLSSALPVLLLGLPVIDTLTVMAMRLREGHSPFKADRRHLHHRLLALGFNHYEAVIIIYLLQSLLILAAWRLQFDSDVLILAVFAAFAVVITGGLWLAESTGWRRRAAPAAAVAGREQRRESGRWLAQRARLHRLALDTTLVCISVYVLTVGLTAREVTADVALLAAVVVLALVVAIVAGLRRPRWNLDRLVQPSLYVGAVLVVYLDHAMAQAHGPLWIAKWALLSLLAIAVVLGLRLAGQRRFEVTPLDFLLLIIALVLPNLPGIDSALTEIGLGLAKLVVLMYSAELLFNEAGKYRLRLSALFAASLGILVLRALPGL